MYYVYVLHSAKSNNFYVGYTEDLKRRILLHNAGWVFSTKPYTPWKLIYYLAFEDINLAKNFEKYLKLGSGKAFMYKRLVNSVALKKDK